jgi:hypothetical protein
MAEIVQSLFGVSPEMYQRQQQDRADAQALRFAQLSPFQQANFAIGRGANMLGGAIGGALGGQDPELQRVTRRQQIASQINFTDPASIQQGMNALGDDVMGKQQLAQIYRQQQESGALIAQRNRESRQPVPADIQVANEMATLQETIGRLQDAPASPERDRDLRLASGRLAQLERLTTKPGEKAPAANIKEIGVAIGTNKPVLLDVNNDQQFTYGVDASGKQVRVPFTGGVDRTTAKTTVDARPPGERVPVKDWMDFTQNVLSKDPVMARTSNILSDGPSAIGIIQSSTSNDISAAAMSGALARMTGEGKNMSNQDVQRYARTGGLDNRLAQDLKSFFAGRATNVRKDQAEKFATALYRGALIERRKKLVDETEQFGFQDSPNYKIALRQIDDQLARFKLAPKPGAGAQATPAQAGKLSDAELRKKYGIPG